MTVYAAVAVVLLLVVFFTPTSALHHRRILHQPFIPADFATPPDPADHPFASSTPSNDNYPFFPAYPPPVAPYSFAVFPGNLTSSSVSSQSRENSASPALVVEAIAAVIAAVIVVSLAVFLHLRKPNQFSVGPSKSTRSDDKGDKSVESSFHSRHVPKLARPGQTSAEFLYLGTLANSCAVRNGGNFERSSPRLSSYSPSTGSPELRPLPPLGAKEEYLENFADPVERIGNTSEDLYSPKNSSGAGSPPIRELWKTPDHLEIRESEPTPPTVTGEFHETASMSYPSSSLERSSRRSPDSSPGISIFPEEKAEPSPAMRHLDFEGCSVVCSLTESSSPGRNPAVVPMPSRTPPPLPPSPPPPPKKVGETRTSAPSSPAESPNPPENTQPEIPIASDSQPSISPVELQTAKEDETPPKPKLKQLHWDVVRASSDRETVWDQFKSSSFKLDEEMIENLFVVSTPKPRPKEATRWQVLPSPNRDSSASSVLDTKKSQNLAILLKALHVTAEEVCHGLLEGNAEILGAELLESLLKMAPTKDEEQRLKEHKDDSPVKLGAAEKFLRAVVTIPFAFKRVETLLYISNFDSEIEYLRKSFAALEAASVELKTSKMFLKLLDAVLKTGNRMNVGTNRGDAQAFKLDTLLKLVDVKGADGKTTLLHFVVQEIIRSEGGDGHCRKLGLQVVSTLSSELPSVRKAAVMDAECLSRDVAKLSLGLRNVNATSCIEQSEGCGFNQSVKSFATRAEEEISNIQAQERGALSMVKEVTEYFHGNSAREEAHPLRIFMVVRDFLAILDRVCEDIGSHSDRIVI